MSETATETSLQGLSRLLDAVQAMVPGVTTNVVRMELFTAIQDFCARSTVWRETLSWAMAPGQSDFDFNPVDANAQASGILQVTGLTRWRAAPPAILVDLGEATTSREGTAVLACRPSRLDDYLPTWLTDEWFEALRDGTLARLYSHPAKPYSAPQYALAYERKYRSGIQAAKDQALRGFSPGTSGWRFPYFAGGRQR